MRVAGCWLYSFLFLVLPGIAFSSVTYETVRVGPGVYAPSGATQYDVTVATRRPDGVTKYHNVRPTMSPSTLGKFGRAAVRGGPASLAVVGIIEGLDYLIDQATGDLQKVEITYGPPTGPSVSGINGSSGDTWCRSDPPQSKNTRTYFAFVSYSNSSCSSSAPHRYKFWAWNCPASHPIGYNNDWTYAGRCYPDNSSRPPIESIIDLDPSDYHVIDNALGNQLTLQQKTDLARRVLTMPQSEVATTWPELAALAESVREAEQAVWDATTDPTVMPTPEQEQVVQDGVYELPHVYPDSGSGFWPEFCEWASFICEPFVATPHPDVPTVNLEVEEFDSDLPGDASCPAPYTFETDFTGPIEISFQPACDLAAAIRVPLLAISYLMAGFIVVGVRR